MMVYSAQYASPVGALTLCAHEDKLAGLWLEGQKYFGASVSGEIVPDEDVPVLIRAREWLNRYFAGEAPSPTELPLYPVGTPFQKTVWKLLLEIPYGQTVTYGQLSRRTAAALGRPSMAAQAVGSAAGHNPISIIIPCHRLVGAGGSLTGYAGGLERKRWLLRHEEQTTGHA